MAKTLDVVGAVIIEDGRVLACRRRPEKSAGGKWEFPGGKIEEGEAPEKALEREIQEELGVKIRVLDTLNTSETVVEDRTIRLTCMRAKFEGPRPETSTDHDRLEWVRVDSLPAFDWAAPDLPAVSMLVGEFSKTTLLMDPEL